MVDRLCEMICLEVFWHVANILTCQLKEIKSTQFQVNVNKNTTLLTICSSLFKIILRGTVTFLKIGIKIKP